MMLCGVNVMVRSSCDGDSVLYVDLKQQVSHHFRQNNNVKLFDIHP